MEGDDAWGPEMESEESSDDLQSAVDYLLNDSVPEVGTDAMASLLSGVSDLDIAKEHDSYIVAAKV